LESVDVPSLKSLQFTGGKVTCRKNAIIGCKK
jgi:hypothetical protein